jgi:hypothetical protein
VPDGINSNFSEYPPPRCPIAPSKIAGLNLLVRLSTMLVEKKTAQEPVTRVRKYSRVRRPPNILFACRKSLKVHVAITGLFNKFYEMLEKLYLRDIKGLDKLTHYLNGDTVGKFLLIFCFRFKKIEDI